MTRIPMLERQRIYDLDRYARWLYSLAYWARRLEEGNVRQARYQLKEFLKDGPR